MALAEALSAAKFVVVFVVEVCVGGRGGGGVGCGEARTSNSMSTAFSSLDGPDWPGIWMSSSSSVAWDRTLPLIHPPRPRPQNTSTCPPMVTSGVCSSANRAKGSMLPAASVSINDPRRLALRGLGAAMVENGGGAGGAGGETNSGKAAEDRRSSGAILSLAHDRAGGGGGGARVNPR